MKDLPASLVRIAPTLATLALLVLGGFLAARWVAYFAVPSESAAPPARERPQLGPAAQTLAGTQLFGVASARETVSNLNVKLRGVFAGGGTGTGFAIVNAGGRDQATRIGGEIVPGVTLESVHAGHVVLRRAGALERVNLDERVSGQAPGASGPRYAQAAPPPPRPAPAPGAAGAAPAPSQSSNPGARFKRPEPYAPVGDVPTESQPPAPALAPAPESAPRPPAPRPLPGGTAQGLLIQDVPPGSMLERIGLQPGDVVRSVNGEAVTSEADVARVLQQRGMQGSFTAEVQRGGMTVPIAVSGVR